jgi:hypothetical protein
MRIFHSLAVAGFAATVTIASTMVVNAQERDRVCREVCSGGVCRQECIQTEGRGDRERREERRELREERRERREPGIELRVPVPDIRVTPPS